MWALVLILCFFLYVQNCRSLFMVWTQEERQIPCQTQCYIWPIRFSNIWRSCTTSCICKEDISPFRWVNFLLLLISTHLNLLEYFMFIFFLIRRLTNEIIFPHQFFIYSFNSYYSLSPLLLFIIKTDSSLLDLRNTCPYMYSNMNETHVHTRPCMYSNVKHMYSNIEESFNIGKKI